MSIPGVFLAAARQQRCRDLTTAKGCAPVVIIVNQQSVPIGTGSSGGGGGLFPIPPFSTIFTGVSGPVVTPFNLDFTLNTAQEIPTMPRSGAITVIGRASGTIQVNQPVSFSADLTLAVEIIRGVTSLRQSLVTQPNFNLVGNTPFSLLAQSLVNVEAGDRLVFHFIVTPVSTPVGSVSINVSIDSLQSPVTIGFP